MSVLIKAWEHFKTITRHRHGVIKNCYKAGILWQGLRHDLSKYSPEEFLKGCKYYQGTRSPHEAEREEYGFSYGWMHHKGRNKHHFEYWTDYDLRTKLMTPVKMPLKYVKEMFCDRVAASKIYMKDKYDDGAPLAYFLRAKKTRAIHPETSDLLEKLLTMLRDKGEDYTFAYIRTFEKILGGVSMEIFKKKTVKPVPEECRGMEIKIMSSTCTGEKTIGFYNRNTREIMYPELVKSDSDVEAFYEKYGLKK